MMHSCVCAVHVSFYNKTAGKAKLALYVRNQNNTLLMALFDKTDVKHIYSTDK